MYKISRFNTVVEKDNKILLYNSFSNAFISLTKNEYKQLLNIKETVNEIKPDNLDTLLKLGFIVLDNIDELEIFNRRELDAKFKDISKSITSVIAPSLKCNFRCRYCFESDNYSTYVMSDEIMLNTIEFIKNLAITNNIYNLHIQWFGGEPLLNYSIIEFISKELINFSKENNITYSASIVTNGRYLNKDMALKLKDKCKVNRAQISIEGESEDFTFLKNTSKKQFKIVLNNIVEVSDILSLSIRLNSTNDNLNSLKSISKRLLIDYKLLNKINIYLAFLQQFTSEPINYVDIDNQYHIKNDFNEYLKSIGYTFKNNIMKKKNTYCGLVKNNNYCIGPYGELYKCESELGNKLSEIGNVIDGLNKNKYYYDFLNINRKSECDSCEILPYCFGGCYLCQINNDKINCEHIKAELSEKLLNYYVER